MAIQSEQSQAARLPLSRERVLRAAIDLADEGGLESLSMRKLAQTLGVEAMSLYHHVASKDDILDAAVDLVVGEIELPDPAIGWKAAIRRTAISAHETFLRHSWAAGLVLSGPTVLMARLRYMDGLLGTLRGAGFSAEMTDHAYHALDSHIMGFTLWEVGITEGMARLPGTIASFLEAFPAAEFPHIAEHIGQHLQERDPADEGSYAFGLDLILDGLERMRMRDGA
jgi:AcrR family transcriptional regulator